MAKFYRIFFLLLTLSFCYESELQAYYFKDSSPVMCSFNQERIRADINYENRLEFGYEPVQFLPVQAGNLPGYLLAQSNTVSEPGKETMDDSKDEAKDSEDEAEDSEDEAEDSEDEAEDSEDEFDDFEDEFKETSEDEVFDPLSGYNRFMTNVNDKLYVWVLDPVARGYRWVVPEGGRRGIDRFFINLLYPIRFVNNLLQLKFKNAGTETLRFVTNTTIGILGFWDPAKAWFNLEARPEDFGQTLGYYGVGGGFHIVLPILGPSNLRDMLSMYPDQYAKYDDKYYLDPKNYVEGDLEKLGLRVFEEVNWTSLHIGEYESFKKDAIDWYLFLRDAYEQNRNKKIKE